ncbi:MAG TPA: GNAT family N-acetyltransferase, partial [Roseiflexaceae bacterium]|nr:GNAT family N-acetyltransferase [Roseiflexaceae bacterium]
MAIEIRPLTLAIDAESIAAVVSLAESEPVLPQHVREWDDMPVDGKQVCRIGAFAPTGQMIGYGAASTGPWLPERNFGVVAIVLPEYRGQGIGARLFDELADWSHANGAQRLKSEVRDNDPTALRFARKRNFEIERHIFESVLDLTTFDFAP